MALAFCASIIASFCTVSRCRAAEIEYLVGACENQGYRYDETLVLFQASVRFAFSVPEYPCFKRDTLRVRLTRVARIKQPQIEISHDLKLKLTISGKDITNPIKEN